MNIFISPAFINYYKDFPLVLADIGARGGLQSNWKPAEKHLLVVGVEPDPQEFAKIAGSSTPDTRSLYLNTALYKEKTRLDFFLTKSRGGSSLLKPNRTFLDQFPESERFDVIRTIQMETDTLDNQLQEHQVNDIDFIKIDTQGSELFILEGATTILTDSVFGLEIEVEFVHMYENQPLFEDVDAFVKKFGFYLFDLKPYYWKRSSGKGYGKSKGQLIFG